MAASAVRSATWSRPDALVEALADSHQSATATTATITEDNTMRGSMVMPTPKRGADAVTHLPHRKEETFPM
jgi:hypothetical protein